MKLTTNNSKVVFYNTDRDLINKRITKDTEILILYNFLVSDTEIITNNLINIPLALKYIVVISNYFSRTSGSIFYSKFKLKLPFSCKLLCFSQDYEVRYYKKKRVGYSFKTSECDAIIKLNFSNSFKSVLDKYKSVALQNPTNNLFGSTSKANYSFKKYINKFPSYFEDDSYYYIQKN